MRRMYSKEQLQKLIDEVSRLIAIEELDKVVPVPSLDKAGYVMQVNETGTGYKLVSIGEAIEVKPIYCHPVQFDLFVDGDTQTTFLGKITALIFNNSDTPFTKTTFIEWLDSLYSQVGSTIRILNSGGFKDNSNNIAIASYLARYQSGYLFVGINASTGAESNLSYSTKANIIAAIGNFNDGVNKIN